MATSGYKDNELVDDLGIAFGMQIMPYMITSFSRRRDEFRKNGLLPTRNKSRGLTMGILGLAGQTAVYSYLAFNNYYETFLPIGITNAVDLLGELMSSQ